MNRGLNGRALMIAGRALACIVLPLMMGAEALPVLAQATFVALGGLSGEAAASEARAISADGRVVVGCRHSAAGVEAVRWTDGSGPETLGTPPGGNYVSFATGTSGNGAVVVGHSAGASGCQAFRWTSAQGMASLGVLPGGEPDSIACGVSANGECIVGTSGSGSSQEAFRWTPTTGMQRLANPPQNPLASSAVAVSADGTVIVGRANISCGGCGGEAIRWTAATGIIALGDLPGGSGNCSATAVSQRGEVVVGAANIHCECATGEGTVVSAEAFRWTDSEGMIGLGYLPGGGALSVATGVSADGAAVVGWATEFGNPTAFIWDSTHGMRNLRTVLETEYGLVLYGWVLLRATGVSADGQTIVGIGINPIGQYEAWLVHLSPPCTAAQADANCDGWVNFFDADPFLTALLDAASYAMAYCDGETCAADVDRSGRVDFFDVDPFLGCVLGGCP